MNEEDVVIVLAWKTNQEYISDCSNAYTAGKTLYMSTRLGDLYHKWTRVNKATMRIHHKSGDNFEVDWAGKTLPIYDSVIGAGENKYIVQEVFQKLYGDYPMPEKMPMPRDTNEWFKDWENPIRSEFWPYCTDHVTGDQKWLVCA